VLIELSVWLALANGIRNTDSVEAVLPELEALAQFADELGRRLASERVDGLAGLIDLHRRLRTVLSGVPGADLAHCRGEIAAFERWLGDVARQLEELARLKRLPGV
jgi:hypothetical protein